MPQEGRPTGSGFTLIETLIGIAIFAIVSTGIFLGYRSVLDIVQSSQYNASALSIIESQVELVRNMRYEDVGTVGGVPAGLLPQVQDVELDSIPYQLHTYVRDIDDPFDGTLGGTPNDTAPADYKLVEFQITCDVCPRYNLIRMTTYVAPKNLETSTKNGNLFIRVFDASGLPVAGATVHITNPSVSPAVDLTDVTDVNGQLQLVDVATSSAEYHITATKSGYTTDQTYPPGSPPNPLQPDATVATQALTITSLSIDRVSTLTIDAHDAYCAAPPGFDFLMTGSRLIATGPDVPRYSQALHVGASGELVVGQLGWDTYSLQTSEPFLDIAAADPGTTITLDPNTSKTADWLIAPRSQTGLSVEVTDIDGNPLNDALVRVSGNGYDRTAYSGQWTWGESSWSDASIAARSDGMDVGDALAVASVGGVYASASQWLESRTLDLGTQSTVLHAIEWSGSQPAQTHTAFQVAANNDGSTWSYVGPDGTAGTFFTTSGEALPASLDNRRYLRYRVTLQTDDSSATPSVDEVSIRFGSACLVDGSAYFNGLDNATHTLTVSKAGFTASSASIDLPSAWQRTTVILSP